MDELLDNLPKSSEVTAGLIIHPDHWERVQVYVAALERRIKLLEADNGSQ